MPPAPAVCIGEALTVLVPEHPGPLECADVFSRSVGGAELNVAIGLAALGVPSSLITRVGDDGFGRHTLATLGSLDVDVSAVEIDPSRPTGLYVKEIGGGSPDPHDLAVSRSRMHYYRTGSAGSALSPASLQSAAARALLRGAPFVHLTGVTAALSPGARDMCLALRSVVADRTVSFDVNWRPQLWRGREAEGVEVLRRICATADLVFLGMSEAQVLFGTVDAAELRARLPEPRALVLKNDGEAAVAYEGEHRVEVAPRAAQVSELIGAGDAFAAGYLSEFAAGSDAATALAAAHSAAARALASTSDHIGADSASSVPEAGS